MFTRNKNFKKKLPSQVKKKKKDNKFSSFSVINQATKQ